MADSVETVSSTRSAGRISGANALAVLVAAALLLVLLPVVGHPDGPGPSGVAGSSGPSFVVPSFGASLGVRDVGPLPAEASLTIAVSLAPAGGAALTDWASGVSIPGSASYRQFLSPSETSTRFGASPAAIAAAAGYFQSFGLSVRPSSDRLFLAVSGPSHGIAAAFHTSFEQYSSGGGEFYSHPTPATLPSLAPWYGVLGLGNVGQIRPLSSEYRVGPFASGCSGSPPITPCAMATAYDYSGEWGVGHNGTGERIGVVDVFDSTENTASLTSDVAQFSSTFGLPTPSVTFTYPTESESALNGTSPDGWSVEDALDLQWVHGTAPGASITVALAPNSNPGLYGAVDSLVAAGSVDVISLSWGEPDVGAFNSFATACPFECNASSDGSYSMLHPVLEAAAVEGIGVFVASGDCGSADGTNGIATDYPASDPFATGVGGTVLGINSDATYSSESAWSGNASGASNPGCQNQGGSGGGFSPFPRPSWQHGPGFPLAAGRRGVPDVSLDAASGAALFFQGSEAAASGTSLSAPVWAGIAAIADQVAGKRLGFLAPSLYPILAGAQYSSAFHDITTGSNGYSAGSGWDAVTGIGSPIVGALLPILTERAPVFSNLTARLSASVRAGGTPLTVNFSVNTTGGSGTAFGYDFSFGDGNATWSTTPATSYTYTVPGAYPASVTVFDSGGNSTISAPYTIVVGGGSLLPVDLTLNTTTVSVGGTIGFQVVTAGGTGAETIAVEFGDGTYSLPSSALTTSHTFNGAGGFCVTAVVTDSASPADGGNSTPMAVSVGGALRPHCSVGPSVSAHLSANYTLADLPGDIPLTEGYAGGVPPLTAWLDSNDPYSVLCQCGIFRTPGVHTVDLVVNDSVGNTAVSPLSLTLFPSLVGNFTASTLSGPAPLSVSFSVSVSGGYLPNASTTRWAFGDGGTATGPMAVHQYNSSGEFLAVGDARDGGRGNASEAFLIDVLPASGGTAPVLTAAVSPAVDAAAGLPTSFVASATGAGGPYSLEWSFSDGGAGFGPQLNETFGWGACEGLPNCPLGVTILVRAANGSTWSFPFTLNSFLSLDGSGLTVSDTALPSSGTTPFTLVGSVAATGMPGVRVTWEFGDGTGGTGTSARHTYLAPGNYTVTEQILDQGGDLWVRHHAVAINGTAIQPLSASIAPSTTLGLAPFSPQLAAVPSGGYGPFSYTWTLGDGGTATGASIHPSYG
ncbi:MAG: PKD domain-containing protein, partial [Thermoplasmata archaeon]|nr:PKD domain-containing protein [Thermoplasmata archaeon]